MNKEMIDIYDENLKRIGTVSRDEANNSGVWHRSIHIWIVRPIMNGFVLFQKRGRDQKLFPNLLDVSAAGHYQSGENVREGVREIFEELGIYVTYEELVPLGIKIDVAKIGDITNREFCDVFLLLRSESPEEYHMDPSEVEGLVQIKIGDGLKLFCGEVDQVPAEGVKWLKEKNTWNKIRINVRISDFVPRVDPYYFKIFIMAKALISKEKYLSI